MTTGQRIAAKRKEFSFSQEGLGEQLGVSRQSIYKWESDISLPEIDKLVAMSRLFRVPVGWLLGVEEEDTAPQSADVLTEGQLHMVEEIFRRYTQSQQPDQTALSEDQLRLVEEAVGSYLARQPKPKRRRWPYVSAILILCLVCLNLFHRLDRLDTRYNNLQNSISLVSNSVDRQIGSITNRVESVLKAQNELTADYGTKLVTADLAKNTVTFSLYALPKTYTDGMSVVFLADCGQGEVLEVSADPNDNHRFSAQLTCPLTDSITLSAVFITGDTHQTQLLDNYSGLYETSLPAVDLRGFETSILHGPSKDRDGTFLLPAAQGWLHQLGSDSKFGTVEILEAPRVGLFRNGQLVTWLERGPVPENWDIDAQEIYLFPQQSLALSEGDILVFAAIFTDEYGRQGVAPCIPVFECFGDELSWTDSSDATGFFDLSYYSFD